MNKLCIILLIQSLIIIPISAQSLRKKVNKKPEKIENEPRKVEVETTLEPEPETKEAPVKNHESNQSSKSIGAWGGMYFPISPSGSNSGIGYGVDGYYSLKEKIQIGAGIGILPYKATAPGSIFASSIQFSFMPVLFQMKYLVTEKVFIGAGIGVVLATGDLSGYGTGLSFFGGYAYPVKDNLSLDFGLKSYIIKDSKSEPYINLIPNIGITYKF